MTVQQKIRQQVENKTNKKKNTHSQGWATAKHAGIDDSVGKQMSFQKNWGEEYSA